MSWWHGPPSTESNKCRNWVWRPKITSKLVNTRHPHHLIPKCSDSGYANVARLRFHDWILPDPTVTRYRFEKHRCLSIRSLAVQTQSELLSAVGVNYMERDFASFPGVISSNPSNNNYGSVSSWLLQYAITSELTSCSDKWANALCSASESLCQTHSHVLQQQPMLQSVRRPVSQPSPVALVQLRIPRTLASAIFLTHRQTLCSDGHTKILFTSSFSFAEDSKIDNLLITGSGLQRSMFERSLQVTVSPVAMAHVRNVELKNATKISFQKQSWLSKSTLVV